MKQGKDKAFILADSLIALTIISLSITFTLVSHECLIQQSKRQQVNLVASRMAKEATDELVATNRPVFIKQNEFSAVASRKGVNVYRYRQPIFEVRR
ncbi:type II secretion system protein [Limosilactobacillus fastidiosus]|uniref:Type II secretion system protein n=1 Tax=Limosilactobacillus fastidiosus TaxID=2759855 RepID=A0A7W3TY55_9LACO|nr:type II secretion system protein [Limosilactobacillus fastidiosus]MBB1062634.1 type II secretion system protein [Limosilactobacillus fastidiosus]MBB1085444.1 type II secretion system protein [Limosilactobacillus fastidiosus]MCD7083802.1 type II secretion system GspH family protein [Limosilactobacillus fastidiosus]MCD7085346.1 type II secretion system GspH family protein [Limosilactobacillus fastidiosus]MCD7114080.1 type II secretion system GspH family protein [Limosilactobacillus fastidiosu